MILLLYWIFNRVMQKIVKYNKNSFEWITKFSKKKKIVKIEFFFFFFNKSQSWVELLNKILKRVKIKTNK